MNDVHIFPLIGIALRHRYHNDNDYRESVEEEDNSEIPIAEELKKEKTS